KQSYIDHILTGVAPHLVMSLVIFGLISMQPDLGTAMIIGLIASCMILCSGCSGRTRGRVLVLGGRGWGVGGGRGAVG
ncbi:FtsW/RodA/SpoVE family cell cycle protein, partial [Bacillus subtilis]|uniref:FtsW/RodA/SpoVE family cell cycle protein n=1 Tax=Bacillus subtilis TaxID=1423 RepID=UPI0024AE1DFA